MENLEPKATRQDLQAARRFFHLANGVAIATVYALLLTHAQVVHLFGIIACVVYIVDRARIAYPEALRGAPWVNQRFLRAEEHLREAAMTPFVIGTLLALLTFPKRIALISIYTLAVADPLSAVVGITWGRRHIVPQKTVEGSLAFLAATAAVTAGVLTWTTAAPVGVVVAAALVIGTLGAMCEALPIRLDDNLTIPLGVGFSAWIACALLGVRV